MTLSKFLRALGAKKNRALLSTVNGGDLRTETLDGKCCPITLVAYQRGCGFYRASQYPTAARALGLDLDLANAIAGAADSRFTEHGTLRAALLQALGLTEAA